jgi:hypothetical protein
MLGPSLAKEQEEFIRKMMQAEHALSYRNLNGKTERNR